ncbi:hypothetical protein HUT18_13150 [Streptomyces sp. NA04227]|uniref:hypothetical protein n=1 Tax=Streptomyces sp. NA04227 TaxID=2742136 RepID=UPI001590D21F|nr:hypothetical protein [Streptomyces sp. NA04227]QKW07204.1 hypothetical protein HUT18_13150 [Streptomyces sp. NA04227]
MPMEYTAPVDTTGLGTEVEEMLNTSEAEGTFRDSRECAGVVLLAALLLASPPTPRPKPTR